MVKNVLKNKAYILDCTLRDGSYAVNFRFDKNHTFSISKLLDNQGIKFIEVGHGVGIGASRNGYGESKESDETYIKYARKAVKNNLIGVLAIPGIANIDDLKIAIDLGIDFIRVGVNVNDYKQTKDFIKYAKLKNIFVSVNFMKSYASSVNNFIKATAFVESLGADIVYIVDSAGGMFEKDIYKFVKALRLKSKIPFGFHGHNNLGLVHSNTLAALSYGAKIIDSSLNGLGRSSGNAVTQLVIMLLAKKNIDKSYNIIEFLNQTDAVLENIELNLENIPYSPIDSISGFAQFHSSYLSKIILTSRQFLIDPKLLILDYSKNNKLKIDIKKLENLAKKIQNHPKYKKYRFKRKKIKKYYGNEE